MVQVSPLSQNYLNNNSLIHSKNKNKNLAFSGSMPAAAVEVLTEADELLIKHTLNSKYLGLGGTILEKLSRGVGEIQNILFIGFGTGFVAPIFIANNPLSKEDKNSKLYSAARQPISAVIATAMSFGINYPIAMIFNNFVSEGVFSRFDLSTKPLKEYTEKRYNSIIKNFNNPKPADKKYLELLPSEFTKDLASFKKKYLTVDLFRAKIEETLLDKAAESFMDLNNPKGIRSMELIDCLTDQMGFKRDIVNNDTLDKYVTASQFEKKAAMSFLRDIGFDKPGLDEKTLRAYLSDNFYRDRLLEQSGGDRDLADKMFKAFKAVLAKENVNLDDVEKVHKMFVQNLANQDFNSVQRKTITREAEMLIPKELKESETISVKYLFKVLGIDDDFHINEKFLKGKVSDFLLWMHEKIDFDSSIQATRVKSKRKEVIKTLTDEQKLEFLKRCAKKFALNAVQKNERAFTKYKNLQGIILSLLVLPPSCTFLNWSYPRLMEALFPKIAGCKNDKKGGH